MMTLNILILLTLLVFCFFLTLLFIVEAWVVTYACISFNRSLVIRFQIILEDIHPAFEILESWQDTGYFPIILAILARFLVSWIFWQLSRFPVFLDKVSGFFLRAVFHFSFPIGPW